VYVSLCLCEYESQWMARGGKERRRVDEKGRWRMRGGRKRRTEERKKKRKKNETREDRARPAMAETGADQSSRGQGKSVRPSVVLSPPLRADWCGRDHWRAGCLLDVVLCPCVG